MGEPGREPVARIVLLRAQFGLGAERFGDPLCGALIVGGERHTDMAVIEDGVVWPVGFLDLVQGLGDEEGPHAVSGHERERCLEEVEPPERGEFVQHQEEPAPGGTRLLFRQPAGNLVQDKPHQGFRARDVRWRTGEVE